MIFGATGTTQIYEIAHLAISAPNHLLVLAALGLMLVGILFKVSAAPFHVWTPDVYEGAPSPVVALLSTAPKAAAFALLLRVVYEMFPSLHALWSPLLWIVAVLSMTVGNLAALRQQNVKRMLAYSAIAHAGYLLAAFAGAGSSGIAAASFYIAAYAAMNVGIFAVVTLISGYEDGVAAGSRFSRGHLPLAAAGQPADFLPGFAGRNSLYRRILRQVLFLFGRGGRRRDLAGDHRTAELGIGRGLLSAASLGGGAAPCRYGRGKKASHSPGRNSRGRGLDVCGCRDAGAGHYPRRSVEGGRSRVALAASAAFTDERPRLRCRELSSTDCLNAKAEPRFSFPGSRSCL